MMTNDVEDIHLDSSEDDSLDAVAARYTARTKDAQLSEDEDGEDLEATLDEDEVEDEDAEEPSEDDAEDEEEETENSDEDTSEAKPDAKKRTIADDDVVTHVVDGKEMTFTGDQIKRVLGRDAVLSRKEKEASETKQNAEHAFSLAVTALQRQVEEARQAYSMYDGVNLHVMKEKEGWDAETYENVTEDERKAWNKLQFYGQELQGLVHAQKQAEHAQKVRYVEENRAEVFHPETGIKGFTDAKLNQIGHFAIQELGFDPEFIENFGTRKGDAKFVRALNRLYDFVQTENAGTKALQTKVKKVVKTPPKVVRTASDTSRKVSSSTDALNKAKARAEELGTLDAVAEYHALKRKHSR